jgi:hypothetical protein
MSGEKKAIPSGDWNGSGIKWNLKESLPEPSLDVIFGAFDPRVGEKVLPLRSLHQFALQEESGEVSRPRCLLD